MINRVIQVGGELIVDPGVEPRDLYGLLFATSPGDQRGGPLYFHFEPTGLPGQQRAARVLPVCSQINTLVVNSFEYEIARDLHAIARTFWRHSFTGAITLVGNIAVRHGIRDGDVFSEYGQISGDAVTWPS